MIICQVPAVVLDGMVNVHVIWDEETTWTFVAVIFELPVRIKATVGVDWKFEPTRSVTDTVVPAVPSSGVILLNCGFPAVVVTVVVVEVPAADVVTDADAAVGVFTGTDETGTWVILLV